jgi:hypothetical protein
VELSLNGPFVYDLESRLTNMEQWCSDTDRGRRSTRGETCLIVTLSTTNPTNTASDASPVICHMKHSSYRLNLTWPAVFVGAHGKMSHYRVCYIPKCIIQVHAIQTLTQVKDQM